MDVGPILPPRKPARWSDDALVRALASGVLAVLGTGALLFGVTWLLWRLTWGLVGLAGVFAHTGAHAGLAAALVVVVAASSPVVVAALLTALAGSRA